MANVNINDLTAVSSLTGAELLEVLQGGQNKKATQNQVAAAGHSRLQVDTSGSTITLNMDSKPARLFYGSASWSAAKTLAVSNTTNAVSFVFLFEITNTNGTLTLPSNFMCVDARMVGQVFTPLDTGRYKMRADFDGTNWWVDEFIGLYQT